MANTDEFQAQYDTAKSRVTARSMEALRDLFHRLPFGQEVTLADGSVATFKPFCEPKIGIEERGDHLTGEPYCGIDLQANDGSWHLEFIIYRGGWGGAV